jgi:hypothetical protein
LKGLLGRIVATVLLVAAFTGTAAVMSYAGLKDNQANSTARVTAAAEAALYRSLSALPGYIGNSCNDTPNSTIYLSKSVLSVCGEFIAKMPAANSTAKMRVDEFKLISFKQVHGKPYYVFRASWDVTWWQNDVYNAQVGPTAFRVMSVYGTKLYQGR